MSSRAICSSDGSGTLVGALTRGIPMVMLAMGADQPANAERCLALGVAISLDPMTATPDQIRRAVAAVLDNPRYRRAAEAVRAQIDTQPAAATTVALLERLAVERRPLLAPAVEPE